MSQYVEVEIDECLRVTEKAALLEIEGEEFWVPYSQIEDNGEDLERGFRGTLYLSKWICEEKGIECFDD